jgi:hypothetical protein
MTTTAAETHPSAIAGLKTRAREQDTATLVEAVTIIGPVGPATTNESKMARAAMLDVIEEREGEQFAIDLTEAIGEPAPVVLTFAFIRTLNAGETPSKYRDNPGELPGPFTGDSMWALLRSAGFDPRSHDWWERGEVLWVVPVDDGASM